MKKVFILISILNFLHGAEHNLTLRTRATDAWSSIQTHWPLSIPLTLATAGAVALYAGYKTITHYRADAQRHERLLLLMEPFLHFWDQTKSTSKLLEIAAETNEIKSSLPTHIAKNSVETRKNYLDKTILTKQNKQLLAKKLDAQPVTVKNTTQMIGELRMEETIKKSTYSYIVDDINTVNPMIFFESPQFIKHTLYDNILTVGFNPNTKRTAESFDLLLTITKENGFVKTAIIHDFRNKANSPWTRELDTKTLLSINRKYINQIFVAAGGTLYEPQQNKNHTNQNKPAAYAWYNPLGWIRKFLRK